MSKYVIGDIHGCYYEFCEMLSVIRFSEADTLICLGDYIVRGSQSLDMLEWLENKPDNVITLRGNHEQEFVTSVEVMLRTDKLATLNTDILSNKNSQALYETVIYYLEQKSPELIMFFDAYRTIRDLLFKKDKTINDLIRWSEMIEKMPYFYETSVGGKSYIAAHAGYTDKGSKAERENFCLFAREESVEHGRDNCTIIAGHTPTIIEGEFAYNDGKVFRYYDKQHNCTFYNIDCGCVFRHKYDNARLACIRLEDEKVFYL